MNARSLPIEIRSGLCGGSLTFGYYGVRPHRFDPVTHNTIFYKVHRYWRIFHEDTIAPVYNRVAVNCLDLLDPPTAGRGDAEQRDKWREKESIK